MEINQLFYFRALRKEGSFARAAEYCSISQPSLSLQIKKLEEELGEILITRSRKGCRLTVAGEAFWQKAKLILEQWEETLQLFSDRRELQHRSLRVGAIPTIAPYLIPQKISGIREYLAEVNIDISEDKTEEMVEKVLSEEIDFGICSNIQGVSNQAQLETLFVEELHVIIPKSSEFSSYEALADFNKEKLILLKDGHCLTDQTVSQCRAMNVHSRGAVRCETIETLVGLVESGLGYGIIPQMALKNYKAREIEVAEFSDKEQGLQREVNIISKHDRKFDKVERDFIRLLLK